MRKLPFYDLSSHKHKFLDKDHSVEAKDGAYGTLQIKQPKNQWITMGSSITYLCCKRT